MNELIPGNLLPALLVIIPIIGATLPFAATLFKQRIGWPLAAIVLVVEAIVAVALAYTVYIQEERIAHVLGGESFGRVSEEGFIVGIELIADQLSAVVVFLVALVALAVLAFSRKGGPRSDVFYAGYLLLTGGLMGVVLTGDLFNLFVFLEITGLATYALIASNRSAGSAVASLKYLIIGTIGASLYLVGVGYIYVRTGTLNMVDVSRSLAGEPEWVDSALYTDPLVLAGFAFIAAGLLVKAAIFPLHTWQPDAYDRAPDAVTIYVSALVSTSAAYAFGRISLNVFTPEFFAETPLAIEAVLLVAGVSVIVGSALAAAQSKVKRLLAYSSVAQFGLIIIAFGLAVHPDASQAAARYAIYGAIIHLAAHAVIKGGLFATAGALAAGEGARKIGEYAGLAKRRPFLAGSIAILGFGIVGVPPTLGFVGKWYIAVGAAETQLWIIVFVVFASTLLSLLYIARLLEKLYFDYLPHDAPSYAEPSSVAHAVTDGGPRTDGSGASAGMYLLAVGTAVLTLILGFYGATFAELLDPVVTAAEQSDPVIGADLSEVINDD